MNTTTCLHCGQDFPDRDMLPLPDGGELCPDCTAAVRDAAFELFIAAKAMVGENPRSHCSSVCGCPSCLAHNAIAKAKGG